MVSKNQINILILSLWLLLVGYAKAEDKTASCHNNCVSSYGKILGESTSKVVAYSNCNNKCVDYTINRVNHIFTGIKWQCVEYARRWLLVNYSLVFDSVNTAADIWEQINEYKEPGFGDKVAVNTYRNGSKKIPERGDLLIYGRELFLTGHVAVVVSTDKMNNLVYVAEQNYKNKKWPSNYSRAISYNKKDDRYWLQDKFIIGWKSINGRPH